LFVGDVLGFWNFGGIFFSLVGIVWDGGLENRGRIQYSALMLQDIWDIE
jgi:hypothetical protein